MERKKILFITAYVPHKAAAGEKNTMIMLDDLGSLYDVDVIYYRYKREVKYIPTSPNVHIVQECRNSTLRKIWGILNFPFIHPIYSIRFSWLEVFFLKRLISKKKYNIVMLNHSNVFLFGKFISSRIPKVLFAHDVIAQRVTRSSSVFLQKICVWSEKYSLNMPNVHIFSFSPKDCNLIRNVYHKEAKVCLDYIDNAIIDKEITEIESYFMFFGDWYRSENYEGCLWFFENVAPLIHQPTTFKIVGRMFPKDKLVNKNPLVKVEILGFVDDPYEMLTKATALITPLFQGAGIKVKVIESLACGVPVIGTEIAFEGLPQQFSNFMRLCEKPHQYIEQMKKVSDISIENRKQTKRDFVKFYQQENIKDYTEKILKNQST